MKLRSTSNLGFVIAGAAMVLGSLVLGGQAAASTVSGGQTITSHNTAGWGTDSGGSCDSTEWHWVIVGITPDPSAADVPATIRVTWTSGPSTDIPLDKVTGSVAHYTYTGHLSDGVLPTGATAVFPDGTTVTSYNQFNLSHGPCGERKTSTTAESGGDTSTPTSVGSGGDTSTPTSVGSGGDSSTPTSVGSGGDSSTPTSAGGGDSSTPTSAGGGDTTPISVDSNGPVVPTSVGGGGGATTSVEVASEAPVVPTSAASGAVSGELPRTGSSGSAAIAIGLMLSTMGLIVFGLTRRSAHG